MGFDRDTQGEGEGAALQPPIYKGEVLQCKLSNQSHISTTVPCWKPAKTATVETGEKKKHSEPFAKFYMAGRPGRRGTGQR